MNLSENEASKIFREAIVINGMAGTTYAFDAFKDTGQTAIVLTLAAHNEDWNRAVDLFKNYYAALIAYNDSLLLVESVDDIHKAHREGKVGLILGFQTSTPVGQDWTNLWLLYKLGLRVMQLTYMNRTLCGDGCLEDPDLGLTFFGKRMITVMNQMGILLDLSHCGWKTAEDALAYTNKPVICSHTNPYQVCPTPRNFPDSLIKAIADSGGVLGINAHPMICTARGGASQPDLTDYMKCMEHMINVAGIDHVGIGPDLFHGFTLWEEARWHTGGYLLDGGWKYTTGLEDETGIPSIAVELAKRGHRKEDIEKILGLNFLRVFKDVWKKDIF
ncbi:MAG: dipeptidase [Anaerolineaceae bacterium]|jgi:membrane dipeptidase